MDTILDAQNDAIYEAGDTWNLKHLFINGCFSWKIPNLYIKNGGFTKHPFKTGCLGFQVHFKKPSFLVSMSDFGG